MAKLLGIKELCEFWQTIKTVLNGKVDKVAGKGLSTNDYTTAEKNKLAGIQAGAEVNVQSDWNVTNTSSDAYIKNKPTIPTKTSQLTNDSNFVVDANYHHTDNNFTTAEKNKLSGIEAGAQVNVQANWAETNTASAAYIRNKPTIPTKTSQLTNDSNFVVDANYVHTDNNYTNAEKTKLAGIEEGAEKNLVYTAFTGKPTGNQTPGFGSTFTLQQIKQSTTGQVSGTDRTVKIPDTEATTSAHGLMSASDKTKLDGIASGAEVNVQSDWNVTDTASDAYIKNKPVIPEVVHRAVYCTCETPAYEANKIVTPVSADNLIERGTIIAVRFTNTNTAQSPTLTVGDTAATSIYYNTGEVAASSLWTAGEANRVTLYVRANNNWVWIGSSVDRNTTYSAATQSANGLMSAADKKKLDGIAAGAEVNRTYTAFTGIPTGNQTPGFGGTFNVQQIKQDTTGQVSGTSRTVTIPNTAASTTAAGLMSAADKTKLNGIATGAEVNVQSDWNVTDTASDAYIKNKPSIYTRTESDNRYVNVAGDTMTGSLAAKFSSFDASKTNNGVTSTLYPTTFNIEDSAGRIVARVEGVVGTGGTIGLHMYVRNYNTAGTSVGQKGITFTMDKSGNLTWSVSDVANFRSAIAVYSKTEADGRYVRIGSNVTSASVSALPSSNQPVRIGAASSLGSYMLVTEMGGGIFLWDSDNSTSVWTIRPAASAPVMDGTAAIGTSERYARQDHRHPTDTSRAAANHTHGWTLIATATGTTRKTFSSLSGYTEVLIEARFPNLDDSTVTKFFSTVLPNAAISASILEVWVGGGRGMSTAGYANTGARAVCRFNNTSIQGVTANDGPTDRTANTTWYVRAR